MPTNIEPIYGLTRNGILLLNECRPRGNGAFFKYVGGGETKVNDH